LKSLIICTLFMSSWAYGSCDEIIAGGGYHLGMEGFSQHPTFSEARGEKLTSPYEHLPRTQKLEIKTSASEESHCEDCEHTLFTDLNSVADHSQTVVLVNIDASKMKLPECMRVLKTYLRVLRPGGELVLIHDGTALNTLNIAADYLNVKWGPSHTFGDLHVQSLFNQWR
jgi:hypothetical protein